jgi:hypothetical protein
MKRRASQLEQYKVAGLYNHNLEWSVVLLILFNKSQFYMGHISTLTSHISYVGIETVFW